VKLIVILFFLYVTSPTAAHALIHAAYTSGHEPLLADDGPAVPPVQESETP
jgi:multisubunit Na+/H+ antiporter MnhG subunit